MRALSDEGIGRVQRSRRITAMTVSLVAFTDTEKRDAIARELSKRRQVYPRLVEGQKMTQALADRQIAIFEAMLEDYRVRAEAERLI